MFLKILSLLGLFFLVHCNKGKVTDLECGCEDRGSRRQYLVEARVGEDQLSDFFLRISGLQSGIGGGSYERVRIEGLCTEMENSRVVFCIEDRDYETVREELRDFNLTGTLVD